MTGGSAPTPQKSKANDVNCVFVFIFGDRLQASKLFTGYGLSNLLIKALFPLGNELIFGSELE